MPVIRWNENAAYVQVATTELNGLANGSQATGATVIDNAGGSTEVQFSIFLAALSPGVAADIRVALIPCASDGTLLATGTDGATLAGHYPFINFPSAVIALRTTATAAQTQFSRAVPIEPGFYRASVINRAGVALAASGNILSARLLLGAF
jgi:hypothetical protein